MITDSKEYFDILYRIQDENPPVIATLVPTYEPFMEIDLDTRTINVPEFISINKDHRSETVYFKCARFYNEVDLSQMCGIIHMLMPPVRQGFIKFLSMIQILALMKI